MVRQDVPCEDPLSATVRGCQQVAFKLSQPFRTGSDHRPMLSDLRESGALEQDADVVMLLFRPDQYPDVKPEDENVAELNVAKQRNGPTGLVRLAFMKQETRFGNLEHRQ